MSLTSASAGRRSSEISSDGCPVMPRLVLLTSSVAPSSAASRPLHSTGTIGPPRSAASCPARASERLTRRISGTPSSSNAAQAARAAPPAPRITAGPAAGSGRVSLRLSRKPAASVLMPVMRPSAPMTSVLTAPIRAASGATSSTSSSTASLCGTVTLPPAKLRCCSSRTASARRSGATGSGT